MLTGLMNLVQALTARISLRDESGQALVEYGLLVALIAAVCVGAIALLGGNINTMFNNIAGQI